jgi:nicotinamidase-related amidase
VTTALVVIDMQHDFVSPDGWFARFGFDLAPLRAIVPTIASLLASARAAGVPVIHTRQGNAPDLSDLPLARQEQGKRSGNPIGSSGPLGHGMMRGERGWHIIDELAPIDGELVVEKPGYSAFHGTTLDAELESRGIERLVLTGVTANVCVLSTLLSAVDLGYDTVVVSNAVAAVSAETLASVLDLVRYQGGLFGSLATADELIAAFAAPVASAMQSGA